LAVYKIAARWSDGITAELKTYGLCCQECLPRWFKESGVKQSQCRLAAGEVLAPPGIYRLRQGHRDKELERLEDLERRLCSL
jgi:hypothetical protein